MEGEKWNHQQFDEDTGVHKVTVQCFRHFINNFFLKKQQPRTIPLLPHLQQNKQQWIQTSCNNYKRKQQYNSPTLTFLFF